MWDLLALSAIQQNPRLDLIILQFKTPHSEIALSIPLQPITVGKSYE